MCGGFMEGETFLHSLVCINNTIVPPTPWTQYKPVSLPVGLIHEEGKDRFRKYFALEFFRLFRVQTIRNCLL